jgi:hypothetical protein
MSLEDIFGGSEPFSIDYKHSQDFKTELKNMDESMANFTHIQLTSSLGRQAVLNGCLHEIV